MYNVIKPSKYSMGADGKSAEIEVNPPLTIEPDTDNAGVGNFHSALRYSLAEFF